MGIKHICNWSQTMYERLVYMLFVWMDLNFGDMLNTRFENYIQRINQRANQIYGLCQKSSQNSMNVLKIFTNNHTSWMVDSCSNMCECVLTCAAFMFIFKTCVFYCFSCSLRCLLYYLVDVRVWLVFHYGLFEWTWASNICKNQHCLGFIPDIPIHVSNMLLDSVKKKQCFSNWFQQCY